MARFAFDPREVKRYVSATDAVAIGGSRNAR
jgi:hypothetical protein